MALVRVKAERYNYKVVYHTSHWQPLCAAATWLFSRLRVLRILLAPLLYVADARNHDPFIEVVLAACLIATFRLQRLSE